MQRLNSRREVNRKKMILLKLKNDSTKGLKMTDKTKDPKPQEPKVEVLKARRPAKRTIITVRDKLSIASTLSSSTDMLLNDAKMIIAAELAKYREKAQRGVSLDLKEARVVQGYLAELTKLQREEREESRAADLSDLTNEEMLQLATQILGKKLE